MIKFTLTIWVCSFLGGQVCMPPIQSPIIHDSWYECARTAHKESLKMMSKFGYKMVNDDKIAIKYMCKEINTI